MKILFLDAYFEPEQIAFTHLEHDLIEALVEGGHDIHVVCPIPTRGIDDEIKDKYKSRKSEILHDGKVHVTRFWAPQEGKNPLVRAFRYFWCNLRTYMLGKKKQECKIVFCNSTPPTQGWIAGKVARRLKIPLIYSLQDIFPDSLITTGLTNMESILWKMGRRLENKTYDGCNKIVVITQAMKENLLRKGVAEEKIRIISNWIDTDKIKPVRREENQLFDEVGISRSKYIVLYAGNFGEAQGAEIVFEVAEKFQNEKDVQFVIFGGGAGYDRAVTLASKLNNVVIHPLMPQNRISEVYSMGDVALITCKRGVSESGMPSKTWSIMACDVPIIAAFDKQSELSKVLHMAHAGVCNDPENVTEMENAIRKFRQLGYKSYGRSYVVDNVSRQYCVEQYLSLFTR